MLVLCFYRTCYRVLVLIITWFWLSKSGSSVTPVQIATTLLFFFCQSVFWTAHPCKLIPNWTRNHVITYTNLLAFYHEFWEQLQKTLPLLFLILLAHIFLKKRDICRNKLTQVARYSAVKLNSVLWFVTQPAIGWSVKISTCSSNALVTIRVRLKPTLISVS